MIIALIISNFFLMLLLKGVPTWLAIASTIGYQIFNVTALTIWEETKLKIKHLEKKIENEKKIEKKGGAE